MPETTKSLKLNPPEFRWLRTGAEALEEMLRAIDAARTSIRLEVYIYHVGPIAERFRTALINACQRGVRTQVLIDAVGSLTLPESFWEALKVSGGQFKWFNPITFQRFSFRDHRKILVCDDEIAFIGGFNISTEYCGDGVNSGWRDMGMQVGGLMAGELARAFDEMFALADFKRRNLFLRFRRAKHERMVASSNAKLLLTSPGRPRNPAIKSLHHDFRYAKRVQMICAYFLPTWRLRRDLMRVARRGGQVQIILPGKSDVPMMQAAGRSLYRRLLRAGVEIFEYEPQILHSKLFIIDDVVYAGSLNLDPRSLHLNYELVIRVEDAALADKGRDIFQADLAHCKKIQFEKWRSERTFWSRLKGRWAYFLLARLDPYITRKQLKMFG
jgi:cardiolipin synthase A/B